MTHRIKSHHIILCIAVSLHFRIAISCISVIAIICILTSYLYYIASHRISNFYTIQLSHCISTIRISNFYIFQLLVISFFLHTQSFYISLLHCIASCCILNFYTFRLLIIFFFLHIFIWLFLYFFSSFYLCFFVFIFLSWLQAHQYVLSLLNRLFIKLQLSRFRVLSSILMVMISFFMIFVSISLIYLNRMKSFTKTLTCQILKKWNIYFVIVTQLWKSFSCDFRRSCCICVKSIIKILLNVNLC